MVILPKVTHLVKGCTMILIKILRLQVHVPILWLETYHSFFTSQRQRNKVALLYLKIESMPTNGERTINHNPLIWSNNWLMILEIGGSASPPQRTALLWIWTNCETNLSHSPSILLFITRRNKFTWFTHAHTCRHTLVNGPSRMSLS